MRLSPSINWLLTFVWSMISTPIFLRAYLTVFRLPQLFNATGGLK
jgi:hypothetical protein